MVDLFIHFSSLRAAKFQEFSDFLCDSFRESKPKSRMTKAKMSGLISMVFSQGRKIAKARKPASTPSNGLKMANQNETFQPDSGVIEFAFILFSQAFEDRNFTRA